MKKPILTKINGTEKFCLTQTVGEQTWVSFEGWSFPVESSGTQRLKTKRGAGASNGDVLAPMPGQILKILVKNNQSVNEGDSLFIVEAMKMEHTLKAPCSGKVSALSFKEGDAVSSTDVILKIEKDSD